jgi:2-polyprenyl-3-methyl-5-hydroxy-6-metoxy-1,4-benzoquinol methylase
VLNSIACQYSQFSTDWYAKWCKVMHFHTEVNNLPASYRKMWEFAAIIQALDERGMLAPGKRGLGFAIGTEPLSAVFAKLGATITATDLPSVEENHWTSTGQHATGAIHDDRIIDLAEFQRLVTFQPADMTKLEALPTGEYDFLWSSCAMEHLGTLDAGLDFVRGAMRMLKPGGVAVHTTEYNCSSNDTTMAEGWNVIYRRQDLERLGDSLRDMRCGLEPLDFNCGTHPLDLDYDEEPYFKGKARHIKLKIGGYVSTSFLLIVQKA